MKQIITQRIARERAAPRRRGWRALAGALLLWGLSAGIADAIVVTPSALYIDHRTRSGTLILYNNDALPAEVTISFAFGYPMSDAAGNVSVSITEFAPDGEPSAVEWLRAFPRRLVIQPGQRQVVRVLVEPPDDLPEGEYWGRVLISSQGSKPPIEQTAGSMQVALSLETVIVTAVNYRQGNVRAGVQLRSATAQQQNGEVRLLLDLEREGNAAFLGRVRAELVDANGRVLATDEDYIAVYRQLRARLVLAVPEGASIAGATVRYLIDTERPDLPANGPLPAQDVRGAVDVR